MSQHTSRRFVEPADGIVGDNRFGATVQSKLLTPLTAVDKPGAGNEVNLFETDAPSEV